MTHHRARRFAAAFVLLVCPALAGCAGDTETPMPGSSTRGADDAGTSSTRPPGDDGTTPPPGSGSTTDGGAGTTPPPGDDGTPPGDDGTPPPASGSDRELAERFVDADAAAFAAGCRCHATEWGFASADECATEAMGAPDPAFVDCIASAFAGRTAFGECVVSQAEAYAACAATETCGDGSGGTMSTCDDSVPDCGEDAAAWAALDACFGDGSEPTE